MSLTYTTYVAQLSNLMVVGSSEANFQTFLPGCIDYAEQRIYREMDPLTQQNTDTSTVLGVGVRTFAPSVAFGAFVTVDAINVLTPVGTIASAATRNPLEAVSLEFMNSLYPSAQNTQGLPLMWAMQSPNVVVLGPTPDQAYTIEVIGVKRPLPLSATTTTTFLTDYCPDLLIAASMVFASGYMRDFGAQGADNPQMATSWEAQYKSLFASAGMEQARAKWTGDGWTSQQPAPAGPRK